MLFIKWWLESKDTLDHFEFAAILRLYVEKPAYTLNTVTVDVNVLDAILFIYFLQLVLKLWSN